MGSHATRILYLLVLIEGYVVLATELLAMRLLIPFVGSGTEIVAMVVGGVLLPLAAGYYVGSNHSPRRSVRQRLLRNCVSALGILTFGLSYPFVEILFDLFTLLHLHRFVQTLAYVGFFIIYPVFLLAQTVPLVSHYFRRRSLSRHTGLMLFYSTLGSFLGSVFSTLVLMNWIGVHGTVIVTLVLLTCIVLLLARKRHRYSALLALVFLAAVVGMNQPAVLSKMHIVSDNAYNTMQVSEMPDHPGDRLLFVNRNSASKLAQKPGDGFAYMEFIRQHFITPLLASPQPSRRILVLGGGGFTVGLGDTSNHYDFVDIDPAMKRVAEKEFLKQPLPPNQHFYARSARAFLKESDAKYDLIIIDTYSHYYSIPAETTTVEFLQSVKDHLRPGGMVVSNVIASPTGADRFTQRYTNGFLQVFPTSSRQIIGEFNAWNPPKNMGLIYMYFDGPADGGHYSDDKNTYFLDRN